MVRLAVDSVNQSKFLNRVKITKNYLVIVFSVLTLGLFFALPVINKNILQQTSSYQLNGSWPSGISFLFIIGIVYNSAALAILILNLWKEEAQIFALFCTCLSWLFLDIVIGNKLNYFWLQSNLESGYFFFHFLLKFLASISGFLLIILACLFIRSSLQENTLKLGIRIITILGVGTGIVFSLIPIAQSHTIVLLPILSFISIIWLIVRWKKTIIPIYIEQIKLILFSILVSYLPFSIWVFIQSSDQNSQVFSFLVLFTLFFPFTAGWIFFERNNRLSGTVFRKVGVHSALGIFIVLAYALTITGISMLLTNFLSPGNYVLQGLVFFFLAISFLPLQRDLTKTMDRVFSQGNQAYREYLQEFSSAIARAFGSREIVKLIRKYLEISVSPTLYHIFIYDSFGEQYLATEDDQGLRTSDIRFSNNSFIVKYLTEKKKTAFTNELISRLQHSSSSIEQARITLLGTECFIPFIGQEKLIGWVSLGPKIDSEPFGVEEISFLETMCDQAAMAIERAQVVGGMEEQVRQMNVLARIAQGINITLVLDDVLELIYAQTIQIIPAEDFHIFLLDQEKNQNLQDIFCIEANDRLVHKENTPITSPIMEGEVIRQGKAVITEDYDRLCKEHSLVSDNSGIFSWVSVPLTSGADTIGALSLGKRDPSSVFTQKQLSLLQAIGDQVAGVIVKARLLEESQKRSSQLAALNDITRQLTSTLELDPLLKNIMKSAVEILDSEAGSLLMVDDQTGELIFKVTVGPVAEDLINRRMPAGSGVVGKSVKSRSPIVVNDVQTSPEWFSKADKQTGFITQSLLVVPLEVKDNIIGVLEVVNKTNGSPYTDEDMKLLSAFAAPAAVAIENARLFQNTDQALAARVEELSIMQRIGRELNTSLDTSHAMNITLEWAMKQSGASAGFVGIVDERGIQVTAHQGFTHEMDDYQEAFLALEKYDFYDLVKNGLPRRIVFKDNKTGVSVSAKSQTAIPIRRESTTIGILVLESLASEIISDEQMNFLLRLTDHAAIAISNAQLYSAIQAANMAKSEFVSFVSHELKNPMTSIKGYSELLASGAVGQINENQANFLATIRSNVERMATLVSDLADVSRIEAGRMRLDFKDQNPKEIVEEVIRSIKRQVEEKKQEILVAFPSDLPSVWGDRTRLIQIFTNLISNAYKYTPQTGKISVGAELTANRWDEKGAQKVVHFWVEDNGLGISEEDQKKIFQKFFRAEDPKSRESPGTGLGLNITRSLVELQGGQIWFESEYRKGTIFHFTMPVTGN